MTKTTLVNINSHSKYDVLITRESMWGNPFLIGKHGTREEVIKDFRNWVITQPFMLAKLEELKGKILGCVCHPLQCHGDALIELIEYYHPDGVPLYERPPHKKVMGNDTWIDLETTKWAQRHENCRHLTVEITRNNSNGSVVYCLCTRKATIAIGSLEEIKNAVTNF